VPETASLAAAMRVAMLLASLAATSSAAAQTLSIANVTLAEGSSVGAAGRTDFVFVVALSAPAPGAVDVEYDILAGGGPFPADPNVDLDLGAVSDTLPIPTGQTQATITVPVVADLDFEPVEFFRVELHDPQGATIDPLAYRGIGQIQNDDLYVTLSTNVQVAEGNDGTTDAVFSVGVGGCNSPPCVPAFDIEVDASAVEPFPPSAVSGVDFQPTAASLVFPAGLPALAQTVAVPVIGDIVWEPDERFLLELVDVRGASGTGTSGTADVLNDDVQFLIGSYSGAEGSSGTTSFPIPVLLVGCSAPPCTYDRDLSVDVATTGAGSAAAGTNCGDPGTDYLEGVVTVVIPMGQSSADASVGVCGDEVDELDESFDLQLQNASNDSIVGSGHAIVTILDDDDPAPAVPIGGWVGALTGSLLAAVGALAARRRIR
jgi:hypothetical protein